MKTKTSAIADISVLGQVKVCLRRAMPASALSCLALFASLSAAHAQRVITVRFVDFKSGKPIKNFYLSVEAWNGTRGPSVTKDTTVVKVAYEKARDGTATVLMPERRSEATTAIFESSTKADKEGRVIIHLPEVLPEHIEVFSGDLAALVTDFSPAEVLEFGAVVPFPKDKTNSNVKVLRKPGEIVILNKRVTHWDRMLQEIP
jgi:hypothetical protein